MIKVLIKDKKKEIVVYTISRANSSSRMRPSKKDLVAWLFPINHSNFFWNTLQPVLHSVKIAFSLDFVVTVSYPQDESFNAWVLWSRVAMLWPCRNTWLQFVESLKTTVVFDPAQFALLERAKFICFSSFLMCN